MPLPRHVYIGFDPREMAAYAVAKQTMRKHAAEQTVIAPIILDQMIAQDLYWRDTQLKENDQGKRVLFDTISDASMSTEFAISRFLTPILVNQRFEEQKTNTEKKGWAMFTDCDVLVRKSLEPLFKLIENHPEKALFCVKHKYMPPPGTKMDGQQQVQYNRKNWSSVMAFNCDHPSNQKLTVDLVNTVPGRDLHRFCWLDDDEIGELHPTWNWLVGHSPITIDPAIVHFTEGGPWFENYQGVTYAEAWIEQLTMI